MPPRKKKPDPSTPLWEEAPQKETPAISRAKLQSLVKSARDIMRKDAGLNGDLDRLPQLSWLLFLKAFDERVEQAGPVLDPDYRPAIEKPYRWQDWAGDPDFSGKELTEFVNHKLIPYLAGLEGRNADDPRNVLSTIFKDVNNRMLAGSLLRDLIEVVNQIRFSSSDDIHTMAFVYESILKEMRDAAGDSGEFYTPRPINRFMVQQSFLKPDETILDPACGTGGFLVQAYEDLYKVLQAKGTIHTELKQLQSNIKGYEKKPLPYLLASMNLLLHGIDAPRLVRFNALELMRESTAADRVDVVLTNPPFGGEEEKSVVDKFPSNYRTQETAWLFVHAILDQLKKGGRCAIVLPNGSLFAGGVGARIKEKLMKECNLHTIVRLPQGVFAPYTQIPSNLLFFEKTGPTEETWFYEIPLEGKRGYTKTKPMQFEEFDGCVEWWGGEKREGREIGPQAWMVPAEAMKKANYNLDIPNPHVGDDMTHQAPEELVDEMLRTEEMITKMLKELQNTLRNTA
jgi:type I restriction enzyme M protein